MRFVYVKCQPSCTAFCYYYYCYSQTPLCPLLLLLRKLSQESPSSENSSTIANLQHYMMWKQHHLVSETYQTSRKTHTCYCDLHLSCQTGTSVQTHQAHKDTLELCSFPCAWRGNENKLKTFKKEKKINEIFGSGIATRVSMYSCSDSRYLWKRTSGIQAPCLMVAPMRSFKLPFGRLHKNRCIIIIICTELQKYAFYLIFELRIEWFVSFFRLSIFHHSTYHRGSKQRDDCPCFCWDGWAWRMGRPAE